MQIDPDLIRKIMLDLEKEHRGGTQAIFNSDVEGYSSDDVVGHYYHLIESEFIDASVTGSGDLNLKPRGILPKGHDFLTAVRDEKIWNRTKDGALKAGGGTVDLLRDLAKGYLKKKIEESTGIDL
ncbi:MAG: DUF2513 domain-containing protein [Pseudomonadota bacterium]